MTAAASPRPIALDDFTSEQTARSGVPATLDELSALDASALERLYREATVPELRDLDGDLRGRMLVGPVGRGLGAVMRAAGRMRGFPWLGKSFRALSDGHGEGVNRVVSDRFHLFRFDTTIGRSRAGEFDAVQLDYDRPQNPALIRAIKDEVRELRPGLFLGQAYLETRRGARLVLYFALARR
jgi:hypothetical protein